MLVPVSEGNHRLVRRVFDRAADSPVVVPEEVIPDDGVVIVDGSFLLSRQLREFWTTSILLRVSVAERLNRALARDAHRLGNPDAIIERYTRRYIPGFELYTQEERPKAVATAVIDNTSPESPGSRPPA